MLTARGRGFVIGAFVSVIAAHVLTFPTLNYVASLLAGEERRVGKSVLGV